MENTANSAQLIAAGLAAHQRGQWAAAAGHYRQALGLEPGNAKVLHWMGLLELAQNRPEGAEPLIRQAIAADPNQAMFHASLGEALRGAGRLGDAVAALRAAAGRFPDSPWVWQNLGAALRESGQPEQALPAFQNSQRLRPGPQALLGLGKTLFDLRRNDEAVAALQAAAALAPRDPSAHLALGHALRDLFEIRAAAASYEEAIRLSPGCGDALAALAAICRQNDGLAGRADDLCRQAVEANPGDASLHSNWLLAMHYSGRCSPQAVFAEHVAWAARHGGAVPVPARHRPVAGAGPLRVGYVSADFRNHAVARFFEAIARHHDRGRQEMFCYSDAAAPDDTTRRLSGHADHWRPIRTLSDRQAAELVAQDRIDILVDLGGHTGRRLGLFAMKPAPVQATYLGYPDTTGLPAMDYRLTDAVADPPGMTEGFHTEQLVRLPGCFLCFTPPPEAPTVSALPCLAAGHVTFANFNNFSKVTDEWVALAAALLHRVPRSRCMLKSMRWGRQDSAPGRLQARFAAHGIGSERLVLLPETGRYADHLAHYHQVDIALDTFPYNGTTTTCEALWMGVPVVTLAGPTHVARVGASLLSAAGLAEWVAQTPEGFVQTAAAWAAQPEALARLRGGLRLKMAGLCDGPAFAAKLEEAYRGMLAGR